MAKTLPMLVLLVAALAIGSMWLWHSIPGDRVETPRRDAVAPKPPAPQFAELPWVRDVSDASAARVPLAVCAFTTRRAQRPRPETVAIASAPWAREFAVTRVSASVPLASIPWHEKK